MQSSAMATWHAGEIALQQRLGVAERMAAFGPKVIRDHLPQQHQDFYPLLPFLVVGAVDAQGRPWVTLVEAEPGFASAPDPYHLQVRALPYAGDPVRACLRDPEAALGVLGIELHTRRRNRVNGRAQPQDDGFLLAVEQSFGNCPQYIQTRQFALAPDSERGQEQHAGQGLDAAARAMIAGADTFFVSSYATLEDGRRAIDASHRGGKPGFVRVEGDTLTIPDFAGNLHFNTLGNFLQQPQAGLVFVDFDSGSLLQLSGRVELILEGPEIAHFQGAERLWKLHVEQALRRPRALRLRWRLGEMSPNALMTGDWEQARARAAAEALGQAWRPLRIACIVEESHGIKSFYLEAQDGAGLAAFQAGQHLPLRVAAGPAGQTLMRTYTLSSAPSDGVYRITVKRGGQVSDWLHAASIGTVIEARAPRGQFVIDAQARRPAVLIAAGIGITPLLSMLREVVYQGLRIRRMRKTYLVYAARSLQERAFGQELQELLARAQGQVELLRVLSAPEAGAREGRDYDVPGRVTLPLLQALLPLDDYDFYLCGPTPLVQGLYEGLRALNIADERVHAEQFGPSGLRRGGAPDGAPAAQPVAVRFQRSAKEARWHPASGSLLALAEARGVAAESSCRGGACGACKTPLLAGAVHYPQRPAYVTAADEVLLCCAVPAAGSRNATGLVLDL